MARNPVTGPVPVTGTYKHRDPFSVSAIMNPADYMTMGVFSNGISKLSTFHNYMILQNVVYL